MASTTATITPNNSGVSTGLTVVNGDITTYRSGGTTGVIYLNSAGTRYLYYDGTNYAMPGGNLYVNSALVLTNSNYNSYSPTLTGGGASGTWGISITGNAATATTLQTARTINAVSFNGSADIIVPTIYDSAYTRITNPGGGVYTTTGGTITGAIAVTLPVGMNNTMMRITIKVYEYATNESFEIHAGGYSYGPGTTWANSPFAYIVGNPTVDRRFTVRLGYNTSTGKAIIYIGELASTWEYPQVFVTEFQGGYSGLTSTLTSGWSVGFEASAFQTVTATISNCQVGYATSTNTANAVVLRDGSGNFTAGTISAALSGNATTATSLSGFGNPTTANTGNTIVYRDASGNFSAGTITAALTGNASTATTLQTARTINGVSFNGSANITIAANTTNTLTMGVSGTGLSGSATFNGSAATTFTVTSNATSANTASAIVARDASGNFIAGTITAALSGNATTATNLSNTQSNWTTAGGSTNVVGMLSWRNYGNNHVIFDASASVSPSGGAVGNTNSTSAWTATYPTLMGWNGSQTYGVRVDTSRYGESAGSISGYNNPTTASTANTIVYRDGSANITTNYFLGAYMNSSDDINTGSITYIMAKFGDNYHRSATAAKVATFISGQTMNISGSSTSCTGNAATATSATTAGALTSMNISQFTNNSGYITSSASISGSSASVTHNSGRTDGTAYPVVWASGTPSPMYSCAAVTITSSTGTLTATSLTETSSIRYKENVIDLHNSLDKVLSMRGVAYNRKGSSNVEIGLIAEEVNEVVPEIINFTEDGEPDSVSYGRVTALLIESVKEQQKQIERQQKQIDDLIKLLNNK
jgi:hypothetical protein